jgi:4-hydroxybenzoate polyprenyltransferase
LQTRPVLRSDRAAAFPSAQQLIRLARPHQWVKNGFVLVGWLFGYGWRDLSLSIDALGAFGAFCLVSSAVYAMNDVLDREADRQHPWKRDRPVASGAVSPAAALVLATVLAAVGLALATWVSPVAAVIAGGYIALHFAYGLGLKHVPILDVFIIAAGFMLRILAGTLGIGIDPSQWLLVCGLMVTVFLGFTKRRAELFALEGDASDHRRVLSEYSPQLLDNVIAISAASVLASYAFYTVDDTTIALHGTDKLTLTLPFVLYGVFRFIFLLHRRGGGGDAARDLLHDSHLLAAAIGWFAVTLWLLV